MLTINKLTTLYSKKLDYLDIEIIIANSLAKTREFVLANPQHELTATQYKKIARLLERRTEHEPIAQIVGHKEFYGLDFVVNKHTLVPRPETELMVESVISMQNSTYSENNTCVVDVGTGSGCIITSIAHELEKNTNPYVIPDLIQNPEPGIALDSRFRGNDKGIEYFATDISSEALKIAKKNAKIHNLDKRIKFMHGDLLSPFLVKHKSLLTGHWSLVITANLPYLSKEIYDSAPVDVKKYEPKSALYSAEAGLAHYRKLLEQMKISLVTGHWSLVTALLEISPEQKLPITKLIKSIFPKAKIEFTKDLAGKWRMCKISI